MALLTAAVAMRRDNNGRSLDGAAAAVGGDTFVNNGRELLHVRNASVAPITLTIATPVTVDGQAVGDLSVVVPASTTILVGPFPPTLYNNTAAPGGLVSITYSGVTTLFVGVVSF